VTVTKPNSLVSQTEPSDFIMLETKGDIKDHRAQDSSDTSLVSSRIHAQSEEENPMDEGTKDEERSGQEGEG
jgi:hypothetical protein